jgi:hypothetical protein
MVFAGKDPTHSIYFRLQKQEVSYSQSGNGSEFGGYHGHRVMIMTYTLRANPDINPEKGSVVINYDYVDICAIFYNRKARTQSLRDNDKHSIWKE